MKKHGGGKGHGQQRHQGRSHGGPRQGGGGHGGGHRTGHGGGQGGGGGRGDRHSGPRHTAGPQMRRQRPGGPFRKGPAGPKICPMCGASVGDLARHIRERHDDPVSHPRE